MDSYSDKIMKKRILLIKDKELQKRLNIIQGVTENKWSHHTGPPWHTFHDASHSLRIEDLLYKLIPNDGEYFLNEKEWYYLISAAWLHDVGMIMGLFGKNEEDYIAVRKNHHIRSVQYIKENGEELRLTGNDAKIVAELCTYHRKKEDITKCKESIGDVRLQLLSAYLRLADALHVDTTRIEEKQFQLLLAAGMPWENRFHWLKSKWVPSIIPKLDKFKIQVTVYDTSKDSITNGLLPQLVIDEIQEELDSIRDVLIRGKISCFLDVEPDNAGIPLKENELAELEMVLSNIKLDELLSASEAINIISKTFIKLTKSSNTSFSLIKDYFKEVEKIIKVRPCHNLIKNVQKIIKDIIENNIFSEEQKLQAVYDKLTKYQCKRDKNIALLSQNAVPFLSDGGSVLLFGYSSMVLAALKKVDRSVKENTKIFIAECRGKTQYNHKNEVRYCDGKNYAEKVKIVGFNEVIIIPDISIGNLMARKLIKKVVFGANGIDLKTGQFGHTCGHLAIADLAHIYKVPVYVIADISKFGTLAWSDELEREIKWLSRDSKAMNELAEYKIKTMNPREDVVDPEKVTMLITEEGAFPPHQIPEKIKVRFAQKG